jgi:hypothetical protein
VRSTSWPGREKYIFFEVYVKLSRTVTVEAKTETRMKSHEVMAMNLGV